MVLSFCTYTSGSLIKFTWTSLWKRIVFVNMYTPSFLSPNGKTSTTAHVCSEQFTLCSRNILTSPNWWPWTLSQLMSFFLVVMFWTNLSIFWAVWVFLAGVFTEEEDVDFHWSLVELSHMCRHCLGKDDILVLGLADLKNGDFRGMLDSVPHFIGIIWRLVFLTHHHVHTPVIHLKCILFVNETNHIFAASNV